jgi:hypothetical protein
MVLLNICPPGTVIKTPSSASHIPGPPIYLYEDDTVPLYNFNTNIDSAYGIQNQNANPYTINWDYVRLTNVDSPVHKQFHDILDIYNDLYYVYRFTVIHL